jgi:hypothetical protein
MRWKRRTAGARQKPKTAKLHFDAPRLFHLSSPSNDAFSFHPYTPGYLHPDALIAISSLDNSRSMRLLPGWYTDKLPDTEDPESKGNPDYIRMASCNPTLRWV